MNKRRVQFNFRTSLLSDEAYAFIEYLSETRQLSKQIAAWAEQETTRNKQTPQNDTSTEILRELKSIKSMLQSKTTYSHDIHNNEQLPDIKKVLQLVSSDVVHNVIEDEDEKYDY